MNVVGEVKPDQVALNAASAGEWAMQIASQPTEAAAQSSYQDLLRRYGSVLNGHPANIVKAEIAGKGTFWRVRVPAGDPQRCDRAVRKLQGGRRQLLRLEVSRPAGAQMQ